MTLEEFINDPFCDRVWIETAEMSVYVRKSTRLFDKVMSESFDIATVDVREEQQHTGIFTRFLESVEKNCEQPFIFVENLLISHENRWWLDFFIKRGYKYHSKQVITDDDSVICLYKKTNRKKNEDF